jgi:dTDP-4-dehydrorhamnose reductase
MKVLVLGASGMLGHRVAKTLADLEPIAPTRQEYEAFSSLDKYNLRSHDWIVNCIGAIPQKGKDADEMKRINAEFSVWLSNNTKARIIQIATDCAYSGYTGNYSEVSLRDARDGYGMTKIMGEAIKGMQLRCSIIGSELTSKKSLFEWVKNQPEGASIKGYINHHWNGITTDAFANIVRGIIKKDAYTNFTQHVIPANQLTKYQLVKLIATKLGRTDLEIIPTIADPINRTLNTFYPEVNKKLWNLGGYSHLPTIQKLIDEMAVD